MKALVRIALLSVAAYFFLDLYIGVLVGGAVIVVGLHILNLVLGNRDPP